MAYKLYVDLLSQPSRALYILMNKGKCDFETKFVHLRKGEHFSEEFTNNVNRLQRVPVIDHKGFILTESVAIIQYLASNNVIPESLYPKESKLQARVNEYMSWQQIGLRLHCSMYFRVKYMDPIITGKPANERNVAGYERRMESALDDFDTKWLGRGTEFIIGDNVTVADLLAACELEQPRMAGYDPRLKYPNIAAWWGKVREFYNPYYDEAHVILNKVVEKQAKVAAKL